MTRTERARTATVRPVAGVLVALVAAGAWTSAYLFGATERALSGGWPALSLLWSVSMAAVGIALLIGLPAVLLRLERWQERPARATPSTQEERRLRDRND
jgi:hypothetical protein